MFLRASSRIHTGQSAASPTCSSRLASGDDMRTRTMNDEVERRCRVRLHCSFEQQQLPWYLLLIKVKVYAHKVKKPMRPRNFPPEMIYGAPIYMHTELKNHTRMLPVIYPTFPPKLLEGTRCASPYQDAFTVDPHFDFRFRLHFCF